MKNCKSTKGHRNPCFIECIECGDKITYKALSTHNSSSKRSKNFGLCSSCVKKGERNPFYNKKHTKESMDRMKNTSKKSKKRKDYYKKIRTKEYRDELSKKMSGDNNPMKGSSYYDVWVKKYGKERADEMNQECSLKKALKGEKNHWFGKTPPFGSGNGWSGWYKGWYFRSLLELSYMVNIIEKYNIKWESAENKKYKITFNYRGSVKNYFADFIIGEKYMVECKPKKLWNTEIVKAKQTAAKLYCNENNLKYKLREIPKMADSHIQRIYEEGNLVWVDRYQKKFEERQKKSNKIL